MSTIYPSTESVCGSVYKIIGQVYIRSLMFGEALETKDFDFKEIEIT
jgi:hypothetical protein